MIAYSTVVLLYKVPDLDQVVEVLRHSPKAALFCSMEL